MLQLTQTYISKWHQFLAIFADFEYALSIFMNYILNLVHKGYILRVFIGILRYRINNATL